MNNKLKLTSCKKILNITFSSCIEYSCIFLPLATFYITHNEQCFDANDQKQRSPSFKYLSFSANDEMSSKLHTQSFITLYYYEQTFLLEARFSEVHSNPFLTPPPTTTTISHDGQANNFSDFYFKSD